ncbi:hypothetical protein ACF0H5_016469 [Mactra antiquata]
MNTKHRTESSFNKSVEQNDSLRTESGVKVPTINDFVVIKPISRGAFGKVFLGHKKEKPDKLYAIKAMRKSDMINKNLVNQVVIERDAMAKVLSPFIVQLYYSIQTQDYVFLIMEYLIGGDLKSLLTVFGYFDEEMAITYIAEVTLALEYLHRKRIVHRDLKPDNMLLTDSGHIKLTDFGLSKINMSFNDVGMTPKTPFPHYQRHIDQYRTPGQILSLKSSLAFNADNSWSTNKDSRVRTPLTEVLSNVQQHSEGSLIDDTHDDQSVLMTTPKISNTNKLLKQKSMRENLLSVQASLNWTQSTNNGSEKNSSINISDLSSIPSTNQPLGPSLIENSHLDSNIQGDSVMNWDSMECDSVKTDIDDSVFYSESQTNSSLSIPVLQGDSTETGSCHQVMASGACSCTKRDKQLDCSECNSHVKAPSRQEKITDDTPQMHRTDESVLNSYAAKNLQALRSGGTYNSDEVYGNSLTSSDVKSSKFTPVNFHKPRKLVKTASFSYPSDDESESNSEFHSRVKFSRKRSFCEVAQSPIRKSSSTSTGLTQEFFALDFNESEPFPKRCHSFPRARIRFNSGQDTWQGDSPVGCAQDDVETKTCLTKMVTECKSASNNTDDLVTLSADEPRVNEGLSDESDAINQLDQSQNDVKMSSAEYKVKNSNDNDKMMPNDSKMIKRCDNVVDHSDKRSEPVKTFSSNEAIIQGSKTITGLLDPRLAHLKRPMVSSVKSETECGIQSPNVSSIYEDKMLNMEDSNSSLFLPDTSEPQKTRSPTPSTQSEQQNDSKLMKDNSLLPPPNRVIVKAKKSAARIHFASVATCRSPYVYDESRSRHSSGVPMTPESGSNKKMTFCTPNPRTPILRSKSFACAPKTPFRTPKSVRRAPVQNEEARILGTPDYLAPEVLKLQPHGPSVDWWALGVCMFEFLTGVPPFNDQTPDLVFENILKRDIPWPEDDEALSTYCREAIEKLLTLDPDKRPKAKEVKKLSVFEDIVWDKVIDTEAPWIPKPDDSMDTTYFEAKNLQQELFVSDVDF